MVKIVFASSMLNLTDGVRGVEVNASTYRQAVKELNQLFPLLDATACRQYAVAIDDVLIQDPLLEQLNDNSEIVFLPKLAGG